MDPDETLRRIRRLSAKILNNALTPHEAAGYALELAKACDALNDWLSRGGFLPAAWRNTKGWASK